MRNSLRLISLLLLFLAARPCLAQEASDSVVSKEYNLLMQVRGNEISNICVMKTEPDGSIVGTVVSQFGIKAFDFTYSQGKAQVLNLIAMLDKWYIRKVLRKDLTFILQNLPESKDVVKKKRKMTFLPNGDIDVVNEKYKIRYLFSRI